MVQWAKQKKEREKGKGKKEHQIYFNRQILAKG